MEIDMAKQAKPGSNTINPEVVQDIVRRLDEIEQEKLSERGKFMKICRDLGDRRKDLLKEAKARGIPQKPLLAELKARDHEIKAETIRNDLEDEDKEQAELIRDAIAENLAAKLDAVAEEAVEKRASTRKANKEAVLSLV
jgi:hypothetical protein